MPKEEGKRDIPEDVERYVGEHKEKGADEGEAWALAWSRYCKYKNPGSDHCKQDSYFDGKKAQLTRIANSKSLSIVLAKLADNELVMLWNGLSSTQPRIENKVFQAFANEFTKRGIETFEDFMSKAADVADHVPFELEYKLRPGIWRSLNKKEKKILQHYVDMMNSSPRAYDVRWLEKSILRDWKVFLRIEKGGRETDSDHLRS